MKRKLSYLLVTLISVAIFFPLVNADQNINTFREKDELIQKFIGMCQKYPEYASYESIGKTYEGRDIWIFKIGNPHGGRVMWDGSMHGWEDMGSELIYLFLEWLLESNEIAAKQILKNNYVLFVPIINMDSYERQNKNFKTCQYGVDINRNFQTGWRYREPNDYSYAGESPASEPETQAMINAFKKFKPQVYVNTHYGGGPYLAHNENNNSSITEKILERIKTINKERKINPTYSKTSMRGSFGLAIADATKYGANSWLYEVEGGSGCYSHTEHSLYDIKTIYFPQSLPIFIAMCEIAESLVDKDFNSTTKNTDQINAENIPLTNQSSQSQSEVLIPDIEQSEVLIPDIEQSEVLIPDYEHSAQYPNLNKTIQYLETPAHVPEFQTKQLIPIIFCSIIFLLIIKTKIKQLNFN